MPSKPPTPDPELVETFAAALVSLEENARLCAVIREFAGHFNECNSLNPHAFAFLCAARDLHGRANDALREFRHALGAHHYEARIEHERTVQAARWKDGKHGG